MLIQYVDRKWKTGKYGKTRLAYERKYMENRKRYDVIVRDVTQVTFVQQGC
jgi:hypothetical protein